VDLSLFGKSQQTLRVRLQGLRKPARDIAWKAQVRLCAHYRRLSATGKKSAVVVAPTAREMAAFLWAIGPQLRPRNKQSLSQLRRPGSGARKVGNSRR
jgi:hypothetical protein